MSIEKRVLRSFQGPLGPKARRGTGTRPTCHAAIAYFLP